MTVLAQQAEASTLIEGNDRRSAWVTDDLQFQIFSVRQGEGLDTEPDDAALEQQRSRFVGQSVLLAVAANGVIPHDTVQARLCLELSGAVSGPVLLKMLQGAVFRRTGYATVFRATTIAF